MENCIKNHIANPGKAIRCVWKGKDIYNYTPVISSTGTLDQKSKNLADRTLSLIKVKTNRMSKTKKIAYIDSYIRWLQSNPGTSQKTILTKEYMILKLTELKY